MVEKDVLYGLKQGNEVLKQLNKEMDLATVEKLMDDTREGIAYQEVRNRTRSPDADPSRFFPCSSYWRVIALLS